MTTPATRGVILGAVLSITLLSTSAARASDPAQPPAQPSRATEILLGGGQYVVGGAAAVGTFYLALAGSLTGAPGGVAVGLVAPSLVGATVCWLGGKSAYYDNSCGSTILGAYLGALAIVPGAIIGARLSENGEDDMSEAWGFFGGMLVSYVLVTPLVSTIFWHSYKQPRDRPTLTLAGPRSFVAPHPRLHPRLSERPRPVRVAGEVSMPVLSLTF